MMSFSPTHSTHPPWYACPRAEYSPAFRDFLNQLPTYAATQSAARETCVPKSVFDSIFADVLRSRWTTELSTGNVRPSLLQRRVTCGYYDCGQRQGYTVLHQLAAQGAHEVRACMVGAGTSLDYLGKDFVRSSCCDRGFVACCSQNATMPRACACVCTFGRPSRSCSNTLPRSPGRPPCKGCSRRPC